MGKICVGAIMVLGLGCPAAYAEPLPRGAIATLKKLSAASKKADYRTLQKLMETSVVSDAGADPSPAPTIIAEWKTGNPSVSLIAKAIAAGCEYTDPQNKVVTCPPQKVIEQANPDSGVYLIAIRPNAAGEWRLFSATYAD